MTFLSNPIFKAFLVPSSFSFLLVVIGFLIIIFKKKQKSGKILVVLGLLFYYFSATTYGSDILIGPLESKYSIISTSNISDADIIVVLSGGKKTDVLRSSEVLRISNLKNHQVNLIVSGTEELNPDREDFTGIEMFFINRGIPADNIYIEDKSKNTRENAKKIVEKIGEDQFFLVTSAYHMERSMIEFKKLGANPIPAPTDFRKSKPPYTINDYIPNSLNIRKSDLAFHEYLGIFYYRFFD